MLADPPISRRRQTAIAERAAGLALEVPAASMWECLEAAHHADYLLHGDPSAPRPRGLLMASAMVLEERRLR